MHPELVALQKRIDQFEKEFPSTIRLKQDIDALLADLRAGIQRTNTQISGEKEILTEDSPLFPAAQQIAECLDLEGPAGLSLAELITKTAEELSGNDNEANILAKLAELEELLGYAASQLDKPLPFGDRLGQIIDDLNHYGTPEEFRAHLAGIIADRILATPDVQLRSKLEALHRELVLFKFHGADEQRDMESAVICA